VYRNLVHTVTNDRQNYFTVQKTNVYSKWNKTNNMYCHKSCDIIYGPQIVWNCKIKLHLFLSFGGSWPGTKYILQCNNSYLLECYGQTWKWTRIKRKPKSIVNRFFAIHDETNSYFIILVIHTLKKQTRKNCLDCVVHNLKLSKSSIRQNKKYTYYLDIYITTMLKQTNSVQ